MVKYGPAGGKGDPMRKTETYGHAYGSATRPLRPQIRDSVVLEYIHFHHFHHFQCPGRALISRERVPKSNTGKYKERGNSDPKNMSPCDRIKEFPGEKFVSSRWKTVLQWV